MATTSSPAKGRIRATAPAGGTTGPVHFHRDRFDRAMAGKGSGADQDAKARPVHRATLWRMLRKDGAPSTPSLTTALYLSEISGLTVNELFSLTTAVPRQRRRSAA